VLHRAARGRLDRFRHPETNGVAQHAIGAAFADLRATEAVSKFSGNPGRMWL
jgi:hypothetical protein